MCLQLTTLRGERDIHQCPIVQQRGADGYEVWLVIIPAQAELLHRHCQRQRLREQQGAMLSALPLPRTLSRGSNNNVCRNTNKRYQKYQSKPTPMPKTTTNSISNRNDENTLITLFYLLLIFVISFSCCSPVVFVLVFFFSLIKNLCTILFSGGAFKWCSRRCLLFVCMNFSAWRRFLCRAVVHIHRCTHLMYCWNENTNKIIEFVYLYKKHIHICNIYFYISLIRVIFKILFCLAFSSSFLKF